MKMKLSISITLLLVGLAAAAPSIPADDEKVVVTKDFFPLEFVKYKSQHDIVNIIVPLNLLNFDDDGSSSSEETDPKVTLFFVEADLDADKKPTYKGLYLFKDNKAKLILENGRDAAASTDEDKQVFFAAGDGLYQYKDETEEAVKYGSITDSLIGIAKSNETDAIYVLTDDHQLYKVTDGGNTKTKVENVVNAQQIVLDYSNNLYFYNNDNEVYVLTPDGVKKIEGLPANPTDVTLTRPPFIIEDGVPAIIDNSAYVVYANGSSELTDFEFKPKAKPTGYGMEGTLVLYYAYNKKIYEYNILAMVLGTILDELKSFLEGKTDEIQTLATKARHNKKA